VATAAPLAARPGAAALVRPLVTPVLPALSLALTMPIAMILCLGGPTVALLSVSASVSVPPAPSGIALRRSKRHHPIHTMCHEKNGDGTEPALPGLS